MDVCFGSAPIKQPGTEVNQTVGTVMLVISLYERDVTGYRGTVLICHRVSE